MKALTLGIILTISAAHSYALIPKSSILDEVKITDTSIYFKTKEEQKVEVKTNCDLSKVKDNFTIKLRSSLRENSYFLIKSDRKIKRCLVKNYSLR